MDPASELAADDALLAAGCEAFRLWESPVPFVVLGRSCDATRDVHLDACAADGVPVLRRASGGGTVLQGPGCLNYAFALSLDSRPELENIGASYQIILGWIIDAIGIPGLAIQGSDVTLNGRKVSGNAQRRVRGWVLQHGTLLYEGADLAIISRYLKEPPRQPLHRAGRTHESFLSVLPLDRHSLTTRLQTLHRCISSDSSTKAGRTSSKPSTA